MKFKDTNAEVEWKHAVEINSHDSYGKGVMDFAQRWAELMEARIAKDELVFDMAQKTSDEADTEGITGFMYGCAVSVLAKCWFYGDHLRKWSNLDIAGPVQGAAANESDGVINPAILTITLPD